MDKLKKYKIAQSVSGNHAGGRAISFHNKFQTAGKICKKMNEKRNYQDKVQVYVHREPYGWGFVSGCK